MKPRPNPIHRPALLVALLVLLLAPDARAGTTRLLVSIGANVGDPDDVPLRYAAEDARRVRELFVELGRVSPDRALLVTDSPASVVRRRFAEVSGRIAELRAAGEDVVLFVYVSAHAAGGVLHLHGSHLPLSEVRDFASESGARLRVLVVDACESGAVVQKKGGKPGSAFNVSLESLPLNGQVVLSSSGPAEASEEWASLAGSLFTHHLIAGLRGEADVDTDGRVTLAEAYGHAWRRTVAQAAGPGQHPAFAFDVTGSGELVLSEPSKATSALVFPAEAQGRWIVASMPRAHVVLEVDTVPGRPLRLAVPPGRYLVRKRTGRTTGLLEVELPFGGEQRIRLESLVWRDTAEIALKGGLLEVHPWALALSGSLATPPIADTGPRWSGGLGVRRTFGAWWAQANVGAGFSSYRGVDLSIAEQQLTLGLTAGHRWVSFPIVPMVGLSLELFGLRQTPTRDAESRLRDLLDAAPLETRMALGIAAGPYVGAEIPLPGRFFAQVAATGLVRHLPSSTQPAWRLGASASLALGMRL